MAGIKSNDFFISYSDDLVYKEGSNPHEGLRCKYCHNFVYDNRFEKTVFKGKNFVINKKSGFISVKCGNCNSFLNIPFLVLEYFEHKSGYLPL